RLTGLFHSSGVFRSGVILAPSGRGWTVRLEQKRLRKFRGFHGSVDLLDQQPAVLSGSPVFRRGERSFHSNRWRAPPLGKPDVLYSVRAARTGPSYLSQHSGAESGQVAQ